MGVSIYNLNAGADRARRLGTSAEDEFVSRSRTFDPRNAINTVAQGLFDRFERTAGRKIQDLRGGQVGMGRLGGGYGSLDEDAAIYDARSDLNERLSGLALEGERLNLANTQSIGAFGERQTGTALDLFAAERDRQMAADEAKKNRKASLWGSIAGLAGTLGGALLGGPVGAGIGAKIGGAVARK